MKAGNGILKKKFNLFILERERAGWGGVEGERESPKLFPHSARWVRSPDLEITT